MRVLVLGATGMVGSALFRELAGRFDVFGTVRGSTIDRWARTIGHVDAMRMESVRCAMAAIEPQVVINCIGIIRHLAVVDRVVVHREVLREVNSIFPHRLALICRDMRARLIHVSTDCVFSGGRGNYTEEDVPDAREPYGKSKLYGELHAPGCLTIRTSLIGRADTRYGLLEWFLAQSRAVEGFRRAIFTGMTTGAFADVLATVIADYPDLYGVCHIPGPRIDKCSLLEKFRAAYNHEVGIIPSDEVCVDRSLNGERFRAACPSVVVPDWDTMIADMVAGERQCLAERQS